MNDDGLTTLAELDDFLRDTYRAVWKSTSASGHPSSVRNRHRHAVEQASRRWRGGRRGDSGRTRRKFEFHTRTAARSGVEAEHITNLCKQNWLRSRIEVPRKPLTLDERTHVLERLAFAEKFENVLATKFNTASASASRGESMIGGMKTMVDAATLCGVTDVIIGMPHRAPPASLGGAREGRGASRGARRRAPQRAVQRRAEAHRGHLPRVLGTARDQAAGGAAWSASGDVKYHLGTRTTGRTPTAARCGSSCSRTRRTSGRQPARRRQGARAHGRPGRRARDAVLPVIVHGDAAFAGQGVVTRRCRWSRSRRTGRAGRSTSSATTRSASRRRRSRASA